MDKDRDGNPELILNIEGVISLEGGCRIRKKDKTNTGYELVTRDAELTYINTEEQPEIVGNLGGQPVSIKMPASFVTEFEEKLENIPDF